MGILFIPLALTFFAWLAVCVRASFLHRSVTVSWHVAFYSALTIGALIGVYFGFYFQYHISPRMQVYSFPVPAGFLVLETHDDGTERWTDFITPAPVIFAGANIPLFACAAVLPVWSVNTLLRLKNRLSHQPIPG